jgi:hypothetical protein
LLIVVPIAEAARRIVYQLIDPPFDPKCFPTSRKSARVLRDVTDRQFEFTPFNPMTQSVNYVESQLFDFSRVERAQDLRPG